MRQFKHLNVPDQWHNYFTRYPQGYTILEALLNWVTQVDEMVDNQNALNKNVTDFRAELDQFIDRFDPRLQEEVINTLSEWQDSGFLDVVIDEALHTQMDELEDRVDNSLNSFSNQLTQTMADLSSRGVSLKTYEHLVQGNDWTDAFTQAIEDAKGKTLIIPKLEGVDKYKTDTVYISHDITIMIDPDVVIEINSGLPSGSVLFEVNAGHTIMYANKAIFKHIKEEYGDNGSESDHTMRVVGNGSLTAYDLNLLDGGGDNFYCRTSGDIVLYNPVAYNAWRNNYSIVAANSVTLIRPKGYNANGTSPQAGLDIEPNVGDSLSEVYVENPVMIGNKGSGIIVALHNGTGIEEIDITINNPISIGNRHGYAHSSRSGLKGSLTVNNPIAKRSRHNAFVFRGQVHSKNFTTKYVNPIAVDCVLEEGLPVADSSVFSIFQQETANNVKQGNIELINPKVVDTRENTPAANVFFFRNYTTENIEDIYIDNASIEGFEYSDYLNSHGENRNINISYKDALYRDIDASVNIHTSHLGFIITNGNSTTSRTYTLLTNHNYGYNKFTFINTGTNRMRVSAEEDKLILPFGSQSISTLETGASLTIAYNTTLDNWVVESMSGTWE